MQTENSSNCVMKMIKTAIKRLLNNKRYNPRSCFTMLAILCLTLIGCNKGDSAEPSAEAARDFAARRELQERLARIEALAQNLVPPGTIVAFGGPTNAVPRGWLVCNGDVKNRTQFPALFESIGTMYGKGSNDGEFKLPDLRGMFLRGWSAGTNLDTGRVLGSVQGQSTAMPQQTWTVTISGGAHSHPHRHALATDERSNKAADRDPEKRISYSGTISDDDHYILTSSDKEASIGRTGPVQDTKGDGSHTHSASVGGGDAETRPMNVAVIYMMKT